MKSGVAHHFPFLYLPGLCIGFILWGRCWPLAIDAWTTNVCGQVHYCAKAGNLYVIITRRAPHAD